MNESRLKEKPKCPKCGSTYLIINPREHYWKEIICGDCGQFIRDFDSV